MIDVANTRDVGIVTNCEMVACVRKESTTNFYIADDISAYDTLKVISL
jgi:hypothetical protein